MSYAYCRWLIISISSLSLVVLLFAPRAAYAQNEDSNRVGLVIVFDDGRVDERCISFPEAEIRSDAILTRANLRLVMDQSGFGASICKIEDVGCDNAANCFCQEAYWSYWYQADGEWTYSPLGISSRFAQDGDVEGWVWTDGADASTADRPPEREFEEICPDEEVTETPTTSPTPSASPVPGNDTPTPTATFTPVPTSTPLPSATPTSTPVPTGTNTPFPPPVINQFTVDRGEISFGESATLFWDVAGAEAVYLRLPELEELVAAQGSRTVTPNRDSTYSIVGVNQGGENGGALTIVVNPVFATPTSAQPEAPAETPIPTLLPTDTPAATLSLTETPLPTATPSNTVVPTATPLPSVTPTPQVVLPIDVTPVYAEAESVPVAGQSDQTRRLVMLGGFVVIVGLPLVFAGVWLVIWLLWKK